MERGLGPQKTSGDPLAAAQTLIKAKAHQVQQSDDWQLRDHIDPVMLDAVHDLQRRYLDTIAQGHIAQVDAQVGAPPSL